MTAGPTAESVAAHGSAGRRPLTVGVIGAGTMGTGIARLLFAAGHRVQVFDQERGRVAAWLDTLAAGDRLAPGGQDISDSSSLAGAVSDADIIVEAVAEDHAVKSEVLRELSAHASDTCIIATNTSSFPIDVLAEDCAHPERFLGMHFFNPADVIPGVEVIPGEATSPEVIARVMDLLIDAGKRPAVVRSTPAFIANRLQMALFLECLRCVEEGIVTPEALDTVVSTSFGFRLPLFGPFAIADMAGLDVYQGILENLQAVYGDRFATPAAIGDRVARGDLGLKTGRGFRAFDARTRRDLPVARDQMYAYLRDALAELDARQLFPKDEGGSP
jgi:3-hydroxybutyryl-CoA dehydrogenase